MPRETTQYFLNDASGRNQISEESVNDIMSRKYKDGTKPRLILTSDKTEVIQVINTFRQIRTIVYDLTLE